MTPSGTITDADRKAFEEEDFVREDGSFDEEAQEETAIRLIEGTCADALSAKYLGGLGCGVHIPDLIGLDEYALRAILGEVQGRLHVEAAPGLLSSLGLAFARMAPGA